MNNKNDVFEKIYFESFLKKDEENSPIDDLTKENIITIEEDSDDQTKNSEFNSSNTDYDDDFDDNGWGEEMVENLSPLLNELESFIYELKNCVRGSFTGCKTKKELKNYMIENLAARLTEEAENI